MLGLLSLTAPAVQLINNANNLELELSLTQQKLFQLTGVATYGSKKPDNFEALYGTARLIQTAAAIMVCADGKVEPSEIAEAEEKGKSMVSHFNSLEFREACLDPENLPDVEELSKLVKDVFSTDNIHELTNFLKNIAEADGNISEEEQNFISALEI